MLKYYKIAGLTVKMDTFGRTEERAAPYETAPTERVDIHLVPDRARMRQQKPWMKGDDREYLATGRAFYRALLDFDGLMLHASAVGVDGKAYLFSADSGTGKSTHTALWQQVLGAERVTVINDDKPALRLQDGKWYVYGTPWSGKHDKNQNICCPLAGICFLERGEVNQILPYEGDDIVFRFLEQTYRSADRQVNDKLLTLIGSLLEDVKFWRLTCNMDPEAARIAYEGMTGLLEAEENAHRTKRGDGN